MKNYREIIKGLIEKIKHPSTSQTLAYITIYGLVLWLLSLPLISSRPGSGLDPSWVIAIHEAIYNGYQFGTEVIFNYGPLGHLNIGPVVFEYHLWLISWVFRAGIHLFFIFSIVWFLTRCKVWWPIWIPTAIIVYLFTPVFDTICYEIQISALLLCWILAMGTYRRVTEYFIFAIIGGLLAVSFLIKVNTLFLSGWILFVTCLVWFYKKKRFSSYLVLLLSFGGFLPFFWIECKQNIENLVPYLNTSLDLISGYNEAMAISGSNMLLLFACLIIFFIILLLTYPGKTRFPAILFFFMASFLLFASFKHGFVRQDGHIWIFLQIWGLIVSFLILIRTPDLTKNTIFFSIIISCGYCLMAGVIIAAGPPFHEPQIMNFNSIIEPINLLNYNTFQNEVLLQKKNIREIHPIPDNLLNLIQNQTIDIFPWEISTIWAHYLNWSNRPVIQSQNVYTRNLDNLNSDYLITEKGPEFLLFQYDTIDGRYQPGDEPATYRAITSGYDYYASAGEFILLKRNHDNLLKNLSIVSEREHSFNEWIPVPDTSHFMYTSINITPSLPGTFIKTFFRPDPVYIQFKTYNGSITPRYRLIPDLIKNELFISEFVDNQEVFRELLNETFVQENLISSFSLYSTNQWQYKSNIKITMYESETLIKETIVSDKKDVWMIPNASYDTKKIRKLISNIQGIVKKCIYFNSPEKEENTINYSSLSIPSKTTLHFSTAFDPRVNPIMSDGVVFHLYIKNNSTSDFSEIWNYYQKPEAGDDAWTDHTIDLGEYGGTNVDIRISTTSGPNNNTKYDWALIGDPMLRERGKE